jgi:iron complex outermembrane receptor protein
MNIAAAYLGVFAQTSALSAGDVGHRHLEPRIGGAMRSTVSRAVLAAVGAWSLAAHAQTVSPADAGSSAQPASSRADLSEIVITGSRIITNGNDAPTPVTVISPQELLTTKPTTVFENLASLPMFSGYLGGSNAPDNAPNGNTAVSALNLRNLGPLRALVLFDGHRVPPTTADGLVDINSLPQMLLQRVDVVTGGASAVYGSDAVTGVINFIPDRKFQGVKVDLQGGISTDHDDGTYRIGLAGGTNLFDGRGHIEASFERYNDKGILWREQRSWTNSLPTMQGVGTADDPFHIQDNVHIANVTFGGIIVCPFGPSVPALCPGLPLVGQTFDTNGVLTPLQRGSHSGVSYGFLQVGGGGAYHIGVSLKSATRQDQLYTRFDYDLADNLHAFVTASAAADNTLGYAGSLRSFPPGWNVGSCNAFLAQQYQQALGCTSQNDPNQPTFTFSRMYNPDLEGRLAQQNEIWVHSYFVMSGLAGNFGSDYHWDTTYTHSQSRTNTRGNRNQALGNLYASLDAVTDPATGKVVCNVTLTNPSLYPGCVPINVFGPTAPSQQALNYVFGRIETLTTNTLDDLSGSVSGALFNDWAGPVDMALSAEVRRQTFEMTSNSLPDNFVDCTPLRFGNCTPGGTTYFINTNAPRSAVHQTVEEGAVEFTLPLLKDQPFVKDVSFNSAARFTHYNNDSGGDPNLASTSFNAVTWKAGITWAMTDWLSLRWARSKDIRAPNLYDLYNPLQLIPNQQVSDYLVLDANGQPSNVNPAQRFSGNPHLKPEVAHTTTLGLIFRPTSNFSIALDGYDIRIRDALAFIDGSSQSVQQACIASGGTSPLCALQVRPFGCCSNTTLANSLVAYGVEPYNIAAQRTWGADFETNYSTRVFGHGVSLRTLATFQPHLIYQQGSLVNDQAGASYNPTFTLQPSSIWRASMFVHYDISQRFGVDLQERYRSRLRLTADPTQYSAGGVGSVAYTNVTLMYTIPHAEEAFSLYLNVQNVFNKQPPPAPSPTNTIFPGIAPLYAAGDDVVGRYYTLGVRARF